MHLYISINIALVWQFKVEHQGQSVIRLLSDHLHPANALPPRRQDGSALQTRNGTTTDHKLGYKNENENTKLNAKSEGH